MSKKLFEPNKWIKFEINGYTFIGRTIETDEGDRLVSAIDSGGNNGFLEWEYIEENANNLSKLNFIPSNNDKELEKYKPTLTKQNKNQNKKENTISKYNGIVLNDCTEEEANLIKYSLMFYNNKKLPEA